jgi:hypothetical protein
MGINGPYPNGRGVITRRTIQRFRSADSGYSATARDRKS